MQDALAALVPTPHVVVGELADGHHDGLLGDAGVTGAGPAAAVAITAGAAATACGGGPGVLGSAGPFCSTMATTMCVP